MEEVHDIKTYLANSRIKENISSALDGVFQQPVLPYNPYVILLESFLQYSECYVMKKSHLQLGNYYFCLGQLYIMNVFNYFIEIEIEI